LHWGGHIPLPKLIEVEASEVEGGSHVFVHGARPLRLELPNLYARLTSGTIEPISGVAPTVEHPAGMPVTDLVMNQDAAGRYNPSQGHGFALADGRNIGQISGPSPLRMAHTHGLGEPQEGNMRSIGHDDGPSHMYGRIIGQSSGPSPLRMTHTHGLGEPQEGNVRSIGHDGPSHMYGRNIGQRNGPSPLRMAHTHGLGEPQEGNVRSIGHDGPSHMYGLRSMSQENGPSQPSVQPGGTMNGGRNIGHSKPS